MNKILPILALIPLISLALIAIFTLVVVNPYVMITLVTTMLSIALFLWGIDKLL